MYDLKIRVVFATLLVTFFPAILIVQNLAIIHMKSKILTSPLGREILNY
jgi:hypothetical protein